jgi:hypothetical protein
MRGHCSGGHCGICRDAAIVPTSVSCLDDLDFVGMHPLVRVMLAIVILGRFGCQTYGACCAPHGCMLSVACCRLHGCMLSVAWLHVVGCMAAWRRLHGCMLSVAWRRLHGCMLSVAWLHVVGCMLSVAWLHVVGCMLSVAWLHVVRGMVACCRLHGCQVIIILLSYCPAARRVELNGTARAAPRSGHDLQLYSKVSAH